MGNLNKSSGFSLVELLIVVGVIMILAAIAVPNLLASRRAANEASAIQAIRKLSWAEATYLSTAGNNNFGSADQLYANQLIGNRLGAALNLNVGGKPAKNTARDGYRYRIQTTDFDRDSGVQSTYVVSGNPTGTSGPTQTGAHRYCMVDDGMLRASTQNLATKYNYAQCGFASGFAP